jgi:transcriptional regulator with XRE-family HTH domain
MIRWPGHCVNRHNGFSKKQLMERPKMVKRRAEVMGLIQSLRKAIVDSGRSLNQIGKAAKVAPSQLSRFMRDERRLSLEAAEKICRALSLELTPKRPHREK